MKKLVQICFFAGFISLISIETTAQEYVPLPDTNAVWTQHNGLYESTEPWQWTSLYVSETDTILSGNSYTNIYEYYLDLEYDTVRGLHSSIRQDISQKRVYIIRHYLGEDYERILLDLNISVADTVLMDAYFYPLHPISSDSLYVVDSIELITLNGGFQRRIYYLTSLMCELPRQLTIIEGVGSLDNPLGPSGQIYGKNKSKEEFCCPDYLLCLTVNEDHEFVLNSEDLCQVLSITTYTEELLNDDRLLVYPNPSVDYLWITQKFINNNSTVEIYDLYGQVYLSSKLLETNTKLDIRKFPNGIYFVVVTGKSKKRVQRFIVSH